MSQTNEKFDSFIENLIQKKITHEQLIKCLNKNRFKLYSDAHNESDVSLADLSLSTQNTDQVSYFLLKKKKT
jgi:hypothetical protein